MCFPIRRSRRSAGHGSPLADDQQWSKSRQAGGLRSGGDWPTQPSSGHRDGVGGSIRSLAIPCRFGVSFRGISSVGAPKSAENWPLWPISSSLRGRSLFARYVPSSPAFLPVCGYYRPGLPALTVVRPGELRGTRWGEFEGLDGASVSLTAPPPPHPASTNTLPDTPNSTRSPPPDTVPARPDCRSP
jgi:hypothetical protein